MNGILVLKHVLLGEKTYFILLFATGILLNSNSDEKVWAQPLSTLYIESSMSLCCFSSPSG